MAPVARQDRRPHLPCADYASSYPFHACTKKWMNMFENMSWLNEPTSWKVSGDSLTLETAASTDFWRETHYGFIRDTGHFFYTEVTGDFVATATFSGDFTTLYDQAGLMLRTDERTWLKTGVENSDGALQLSTVITNGTSDWSLRPLSTAQHEITLRLTRQATAVHVQYLEPGGSDGQQWNSLRLGYLPLKSRCQIGLMACSPERGGLNVRFTDFSIAPSDGINLHP
ncbi:DUF1349 domain-containing protein [Arthrobacter sp. zg-Y859]|uniref:DUF1349 domain-containing protein n=1 Tax=Arthrobacter jinronghuae TaxID=2964609 RepID=A0ABT1NQE3_9MICC|nr:DUF1349 domain-containing protein [Arthrobacter jinronghuae]MCQ1949933.1 DUF1349 domain-containing protein [Arthrobacter jinronghuae]UWX80080.1 DUF1349 domain-containing protein [Arthrobacter jinronghuae]